MLDAKDLTQVTWRCIHFTTSNNAAIVLGELPGEGLEGFEIDGATVDSSAQLFRAIASHMRFPSYFGHNWDALDECLSDLSWLPARGYALFVRGAGRFLCRAPQVAGQLIEVWLGAAQVWGDDGVPFHLVFVW